MSDTTPWGFPKGRVAHSLRKILYPDLTGHEMEAIVVCLMAHLLIENRLNGLLYRWLKQDAPKPSEDKPAAKAENALWENIVKLGFAQKYALVQPFFAEHFPKEAKFAIRDAKYNGKPISEEATVEEIFLDAEFASKQLEEFEEMIDSPHAIAEQWRRRLAALGERDG